MNENSKGNLQQKVNTHRTPGYRVSAPEAGGRTGAQRDMRSVQRLPEHAVTNHCRWGAGRESSESTFWGIQDTQQLKAGGGTEKPGETPGGNQDFREWEAALDQGSW